MTQTSQSNTTLADKSAQSATTTPIADSAMPIQSPKKSSKTPIVVAIIIAVAILIATTAIVITLVLINQGDGVKGNSSGSDGTSSRYDDSDDCKGDSCDGPKDCNDDDCGDTTSGNAVANRDLARENDLETLVNSIIAHQTNNRGSLPTAPDDNETVNIIGFLAKDGLFTQGNNSPATRSWGEFYYRYIFSSGKNSDTFADPLQDEDDDAYNLMVRDCGTTSDGNKCSYQASSDFDDQDYTIAVLLNATCKDDIAVGKTGKRNFAVVYTSETGGKICKSE